MVLFNTLICRTTERQTRLSSSQIKRSDTFFFPSFLLGRRLLRTRSRREEEEKRRAEKKRAENYHQENITQDAAELRPRPILVSAYTVVPRQLLSRFFSLSLSACLPLFLSRSEGEEKPQHYHHYYRRCLFTQYVY